MSLSVENFLEKMSPRDLFQAFLQWNKKTVIEDAIFFRKKIYFQEHHSSPKLPWKNLSWKPLNRLTLISILPNFTNYIPKD